MKILVFGSTGMLGHKIINYLQAQGSIDVEFTVRNSRKQEICKKIFGRKARFIFNGNNPESALDIICKYNPDFCINCLGIIKQLDNTENFIEYIKINSLLPHYLSNYCSKNNSRLIHISTDSVYSGIKGNYNEDDIPDPQDYYSRSKLLGEVSNKNDITIRTSIIGPEINNSKGILEWFKSCDKTVYGYSDVLFSGFPTIELSRIIYQYIIKKEVKNGIYNISSKPISKLNLLKLINKSYGLNKNIIEDKSLKINRTLDCSKFKKETNFVSKEWNSMIEKMREFN